MLLAAQRLPELILANHVAKPQTGTELVIVFVNKKNEFVTISDQAGLDHLLALMSNHARIKAEEKIGLSSAVANLGQEQLSLASPKEAKVSAVDGSEAEAPTPAELETAGSALAAVLLSAATLQDVAAAEDGVTAAAAQNMKLRGALISALKAHIARTHLSQSQAAKVFGVAQPRISDLNREKTELFGLDALVNMAATAGLRVEMQVREAATSQLSAPAF